MNIYVASKFTNAEAVRAAIGKLLYAGHRITFDWTVCSDAELRAKVEQLKAAYDATAVGKDGAEALTPFEEAQAALEDFWHWCAQKDVQGVHDAEVFVLLPIVGMKGAWMELGIALSRWTVQEAAQRPKIRIFIVGEIQDTVFVHHEAIERASSIEDVIKALQPA